jgi:hypothetical protein
VKLLARAFPFQALRPIQPIKGAGRARSRLSHPRRVGHTANAPCRMDDRGVYYRTLDDVGFVPMP